MKYVLILFLATLSACATIQEETVEQVNECDSDHTGSCWNAAKLYIKQGQFDKARDMYQTACRMGHHRSCKALLKYGWDTPVAKQ